MSTNQLLALFPTELRKAILSAVEDKSMKTEEIRCRIGQPVSVLGKGGLHLLSTAAVTPQQLDYLFERATSASFHAYEREIRNGFVFTSSGYRIGLCGACYYDGPSLAGIRDFTSVSIRIPHDVHGCANGVFPELVKAGFQSTIIFSPPGYGKTTLLRDLIRKLSTSGFRVAVADERGEISGINRRQIGFDLGPNTDVMTGGRKAETAIMLLRAMNPQILAFDEITDRADIDAIKQAAGCGAALLATAHALDRKTLQTRAIYRRLLNYGVFEKVVWIKMMNGKREYVVEELTT